MCAHSLNILHIQPPQPPFKQFCIRAMHGGMSHGLAEKIVGRGLHRILPRLLLEEGKETHPEVLERCVKMIVHLIQNHQPSSPSSSPSSSSPLGHVTLKEFVDGGFLLALARWGRALTHSLTDSLTHSLTQSINQSIDQSINH